MPEGVVITQDQCQGHRCTYCNRVWRIVRTGQNTCNDVRFGLIDRGCGHRSILSCPYCLPTMWERYRVDTALLQSFQTQLLDDAYALDVQPREEEQMESPFTRLWQSIRPEQVAAQTRNRCTCAGCGRY